MISVKWERPH